MSLGRLAKALARRSPDEIAGYAEPKHTRPMPAWMLAYFRSPATLREVRKRAPNVSAVALLAMVVWADAKGWLVSPGARPEWWLTERGAEILADYESAREAACGRPAA